MSTAFEELLNLKAQIRAAKRMIRKNYIDFLGYVNPLNIRELEKLEELLKKTSKEIEKRVLPNDTTSSK